MNNGLNKAIQIIKEPYLSRDGDPLPNRLFFWGEFNGSTLQCSFCLKCGNYISNYLPTNLENVVPDRVKCDCLIDITYNVKKIIVYYN